MNRRLLVLMFWLAGFAAVMAQAPEGFSFQAAVRDNSGQIAANKVVNVKISVLQGADSGTEVYSEFHSVRTNANGLVSLVVGEGSNPSGALSEIDWKSGGPYFLKMEADVNGGMDYQLVATTQLLSVPYALHAQSAGSLDGTVAFEQVTGVPDDWGFSGSWNDLKDRPALFTGSWNDLTDVPENIGFSGDWDDLKEKPGVYRTHWDSIDARPGLYRTDWDSVNNKPAFFSGKWHDLTGKPALYRTDWDSVNNKPAFFSGDWADLKGTGVLRDSASVWMHDSIVPWTKLINYYDIPNIPTLGEDGFTGSYNDLSNKPRFREDSLVIWNGLMEYALLKGKPVIKDTIRDYIEEHRDEIVPEQIEWKNIVDTPTVAEWNRLMSYKLLCDTPTFTGGGVASSVSWNDVTDKPVLKDTVTKYGFSGDYVDLKNRPKGNSDGDILYWHNDTWNTLPVGEEGQMLTVAGGKLAWIDPSFTSTAANTYKVGEVYEENGSAVGVIVEVSSVGRYATIMSLQEFTAKWDTTSKPTFTYADSETDGQDNTTKIKSIEGWELKHPAFAVKQDEGWYLPSRDELKKIFDARVKINERLSAMPDAGLIDKGVYWSSTEQFEGYSYAMYFNDTTIKGVSIGPGGIETPEIAFVKAGTIFDAHKTDEHKVRMMRKLTWAEATSRPEDNTRVYRVGDIYIDPETSEPQGVVYKVGNGGRSGMICNYEMIEAVTWDQATNIRSGWSVPNSGEWEELAHQRYTINASITNYLKNNQKASPIEDADGYAYWTADSKVSGEKNEGLAVSFDANGNIVETYRPKTDQLRLRLIKSF